MMEDVVVVRSRRARRITLAVRADGSVRLTIPWWCSKREALRWADERAEWVEQARARQRAKAATLPPPLSPEQVEELRTLAKQKLPPMLQAASERTGLSYRRLTIRKSHSRWGSCTREGNISLSLFLAALPDRLIEYVMVHELCHTVHPNHSPAFHALVDHHLEGREKELQRELRHYKPR